MLSKKEGKLTRNSTFIEVTFMWLEIVRKNVKLQSYQRYLHLVNNHLVNASFSNTQVRRVQVKDILYYIESKELNEKMDNCNGLSSSTITILIYIIKSTMKLALENKLCRPLDLSKVKSKKKTHKKIEVLTKTDQQILEQYLKDKINIRKLGILLCLYVGLRVGEICALKWENIDLNNKELKVRYTVQRVKNDNPNIDTKTILILSSPKSKTSERTIPIPDFLVELLKEFQLPSEYYFLSQTPKQYDPRVYQYYFKRILEKNEIRHVKFHVLRHTFATRSIESGMDIKSLSEILGHATVDITLEIYVHSSIELKKNSLENLVLFMCNS